MHGLIKCNNETEQTFLKMPIVDLFYYVYNKFSNENERFFDSITKYNDSLIKLTYAASLFRTCEIDFAKSKQGISGGRVTNHQIGDIAQLYIDSMLFYIRILADCYSEIVPYFYIKNQNNIKRDSFRDQQKWFLQYGKELDAEYCDILENKTAWFDKIAGKNPIGARDAIVHKNATYTLCWTADAYYNDVRFKTPLFSSHKCVAEDDAVKIIKDSTILLLEFYDSSFNHYLKFISSEHIIIDGKFLCLIDKLANADWLYPDIS